MRVLFCGLPGTGKTTLARAVAERTGALWLNKDAIRAALFQPPVHVEYSAEQDDFVFHMMLQAASWAELRPGVENILFDGRTFAQQRQRAEVHADLVIECVCSEETALRRLKVDATHPARNRDAALYARVRAIWEPVEEPKMVVDTDRPFELCLAETLRAMKVADR